uniref:ribonuclease H n=1 Tax=Cyprinus carpio TaxID=7962 RepID=A0A8C2JGB1_CYPCA
MQQALRVHLRSQSCYREVHAPVPVPHQRISNESPEPESGKMQVETHKLSQAECNRRRELDLCLYCKSKGHVLRMCPSRLPQLMVSSVLYHPSVSTLLTIGVTLRSGDFDVAVTAIVDFGSAGSFISGNLVKTLKLQRTRTSKLYSIHAVTGETINKGYVTFQITPIILCVENIHQELFAPFVLENSQVEVIKGPHWLIQHQPTIDWKTGKIFNWGCTCITTSLTPSPQPEPVSVNSTSIESPQENLSITIPPCYSSYEDMFSPTAASKLPPHRPWDCAIDLIPDETIPKGRIYSLSIPEQMAMREYTEEALRQGYIRPSTSPAAASFFFVPKKDGGLRPCIDYRALNKITVKFSYPLPLVPSSLEKLRNACLFTKLGLRSAYNLIRIRE